MKIVLLRLSLVGNLEKSLMLFYGTEWWERGYELINVRRKNRVVLVCRAYTSVLTTDFQ
jgi:hypothetical protein